MNIQEKYVELVKQRDEFAAKANQQIAFFNGQIAMLEEIVQALSQEQKPAEETPPSE